MMRTTRLLLAGLTAACATLWGPAAQADRPAATLLVNLNGKAAAAQASANDFTHADSEVVSWAPVNQVGWGLRADVEGTDGWRAEVMCTDVSSFAPSAPYRFSHTPVLNTYLSARGAGGTVTVTGLDAIAPGQAFTVTAHGVGIDRGQNTTFAIWHGNTVWAGTTDFDADPRVAPTGWSRGATSVQARFIRLEGVDTVVFRFSNSETPGGEAAFGGFSITAVPELSEPI